MPKFQVSLTMAFAVVGLVVGSCACSGDDDDGDTTDPTNEITTTTAQPSGDDAAAVRPYVEELLTQLDEVTDQIIRDPTLVQDPDSPLVEQLESIYAPDAEGLAGSLETFRRDAEAGTHAEPVNSDTTIRSEVTGDPEKVDEDTVTVPICSVMTLRKVDRNGAVLELIAYLAQPGEVTATRVDGVWRLERVDVFDNTVCEGATPA
jgi:hypothetical protein